MFSLPNLPIYQPLAVRLMTLGLAFGLCLGAQASESAPVAPKAPAPAGPVTKPEHGGDVTVKPTKPLPANDGHSDSHSSSGPVQVAPAGTAKEPAPAKEAHTTGSPAKETKENKPAGHASEPAESKPAAHGAEEKTAHGKEADLKQILEKLPTGTDDVINPALTNSQDQLTSHNLLPKKDEKPLEWQMFQIKLDLGRQYRRDKQLSLAETNLIFVLQSAAPEEMKRTALLELAFVAQDGSKFARAQQVFAQYLKTYPDDPSVPEIYLRQGLLYRQIGANVLALSKFYAVMSSSLNLKLDRLDYYQRLVLQAQSEIADTYYLQGKFEEASDYLTRLLKLESPDLNKAQIQYKLVRALYNQGKYVEAGAQGDMFLTKFAGTPEEPEVRFLTADGLKKLGRTREAMQQVLLLLQSQQAVAAKNPETWIYWQQRTGNEIGNQLYKEGDYLNALEIYLNLSALDNSASWQLPVWYQTGLIYERLQQPQRAVEVYGKILNREKELTVNGPASPSMVTVLEMAKWRKDQLGWRIRAEDIRQKLEPTLPPPTTTAAQTKP